jgi:2-polyprenyl-3-methyl-5-hydroxy-6-metoxy-1,4-benzoquinol methylase
MNRTSSAKRVCAVCHSEHKRLLFTQRFTGPTGGSLFDGYEVVACRDCGFCFADNLPAQADFDTYYRDMSKYEHQDRAGGQSEFALRHYAETARLIQEVLPDVEAPVVDIGCANGGQLQAMRQLGYRNVVGVDPSPVCAETAMRLHGIQVMTGSIFDLPAAVDVADIVILGSVLEHIRDLDGALTRIKGLLSPHGAVYIEVPDAMQFADSPDAPFQEFSIEHINFFSATSLANLLGAYGFTILFSQTTAAEQSPGVVAHEVKAAYRKDDAAVRPRAPDPDTERCLRAYIARSQETEDHIRRVIGDLVASRRPIVVWGVGTHTQRLLATGGLAEAKIVAFADSNVRYQGRPLNGIPVVAPAALKGRTEPILVSSRVFQEEIRRQIREDLGLDNDIITLYDIRPAGKE